MNERLLLNVQETARLLGVGQSLVYKLADQRAIPHVKIGARVMIPRRELELWISEQVRASINSHNVTFTQQNVTFTQQVE